MGLRLFLQPFLSSVNHLTVLWVCMCIMVLLHQSNYASARLSGNETDKLALVSIKAQITHDPTNITSSWNNSHHFCRWNGVLCGRRHRRVTGLVMDSLNLAGAISPSIGNLSFLRTVSLSNNSFRGEIPGEMGWLFKLQILNLSNNLLEGQIPVNLSRCSNLRSLGLNGDKLNGNLPEELGSLSKLVQLVIGSNNLAGAIPPSFGNLSSLEVFTGRENKLEGSIPYSLGSLRNLKQFSFYSNNISGVIPSSFYNLSSLEVFAAAQNQLEGSLPQNLCPTLPNIKVLNVRGNQLSGSIPLSISNCSKFELINLALNQLSPGVPVNFGSLKNLRYLNLLGSGLGTGGDDDLNFIFTLTNCSKLRVFQIDGNNFGGVLPNSLANLSTQLQFLSVAGNRIYGNIPENIGNLVGLNALDLHVNQLTGSVPASIGRLHKIQEMGIGKNNLSGEIPSSIGNLSLLNQLWLEENDFQGNIPSSLGNCKDLLGLNLYGNNLSGSIPREVLGLSSLSVALDLSRNNLIGPLPQEVGNLRNLGELNLSHNKLSGEIPSGLGSCISLQYLYLDNNLFTGSIPQSLESLKAIDELDLSHNNLSGKIPRYFGNFQLLRNLNLSFNNLEGEIPSRGVFQNASAISISGNNKLCGGIPALQLPACASGKERKNKMSLRPPLIAVITCGLLSIILASSVIILCRLRKMRQLPSVASSILGSQRNISYGMLLKATNGFSPENLIGTGSFGSVYKGILDPSNEKAIAVKVLHQDNKGASKSFMTECKALKNIRHRNLVKIISACASIDFRGNDFKALVYEYMDNGSLESWLHPIFRQTGVADEQPRCLNLLQRLGIAIDVASALDYLHNHCHIPIIHCDIKPSNVLLDGDMAAHLGDFGLARFLHLNSELSQSQTNSVGLIGTIGYTAPEYGMGLDPSTNGDVYSYGILLLELFTGKSPTDGMFRDGTSIHRYSKMALPERVMEIVDHKLLENEEGASESSWTETERAKIHDCLILILKIGVACSEESPTERVTIVDAARELHLIKKMLVDRRTRE